VEASDHTAPDGQSDAGVNSLNRSRPASENRPGKSEGDGEEVIKGSVAS